MKTVSGVVLTSEPVSLAKAAKILPKFAFADNGASPAFVTYLKLASNSFDELVQLRQELRGPYSEPKIKKRRSRSDDFGEIASSLQDYAEDVVSLTGKEGGARDMDRDRKEKAEEDRERRSNAKGIKGKIKRRKMS